MTETCEINIPAEQSDKREIPLGIYLCLVGAQSMAEEGDWDRLEKFASELARLSRVRALVSQADECGVLTH